MTPAVGAVKEAAVRPNVLVIDDEVEVGRFLDTLLNDEKGYRVTVANSGTEARQALDAAEFDLALVDLKLPDASGIDLLREIRRRQPRCQAIIMTGYSTVKSAVEAVKLGAFDYVDKPFEELDELEETIERALSATRQLPAGVDETVRLASEFNIVLGDDSPMKRVLEVARKISGKPITVLLHGPTGTGKECVARFIHANSRRAKRPFIGVNCGAFAENLLASELFGHEKGAFTGASAQRRGIFELADGGTLFLDEIGEASPAIQVKLLKVLESGEFMRVGGERPIRVDVRVISATNVDLRQAVEQGRFRKDLFYRLDVVSLDLPPLDERPGDIAALREGDTLDVDLLPGKIVGRAADGAPSPPVGEVAGALLTEAGMTAAVERLGEYFFAALPAEGGPGGLGAVMETLKELENRVAGDVIRRALEQTEGDRAAAARLLQVKPRVLRYYLSERGR